MYFNVPFRKLMLNIDHLLYDHDLQISLTTLYFAFLREKEKAEGIG